MIVDAHTHVWAVDGIPPAIRNYMSERGRPIQPARAEQLVESMNRSRIDRAIVLALPPAPDQVDAVNDYVAQQAAVAADRLIPFCAVNPADPASADAVQRRLDTGFRGLKIHGNIQQIAVDDRRLYPVYEVMQEAQLPVLFHSGGIGVRPYKDDYTRMSRFDAVACDFPNMPIILGHAGRMQYSATAQLLRKHPQIYAEISSNIGRAPNSVWPLRELLRNVVGWAGSAHQLLFGSDWPLYDQAATFQALEGATPEAGDPYSKDELAAIVHQNGEAMLRKYRLISDHLATTTKE